MPYYPPLAKKLGVQGITRLRLTIGQDGAVRNSIVTISSGSEMLDQASIDCVKDWTYQPAKRNGEAIAVAWIVEVKWYLDERYEGPAEGENPPPGANWIRPVAISGESHGCEKSFNSLTDHLAPSGQSVLSFTIARDGNTRDVVITQTSGSALYDKTAVECVRSWHYIPATHNRVPATEHWIARIGWHDPLQDTAH
ncbi:MAG: TonB family protein [Rhizomicrobium sp.]|nr:TonB family protein [Rhizomicrobium sp.]